MTYNEGAFLWVCAQSSQMQSPTTSRHVQVASRDWSWWGSADCQNLRSFSTSQDRASDGNNLCVVLTWTKFQLVTYSKKICFFCGICTAKVFSLKLGNPAVTICFCTAGIASIFPSCVWCRKGTRHARLVAVLSRTTSLSLFGQEYWSLRWLEITHNSNQWSLC